MVASSIGAGLIAMASITTAATTVTGSSIADVIIAVAAVMTAAWAIAKMLHLPELRRGTRDFLRTWNGEPARPGIEARKGIPEEIAELKAHVHEIKGRDEQLVVALEDLAKSGSENGRKIDRVDQRVVGLDQRVTDHRRRQEETAERLRAELERRAHELESKLDQRNDIVDERLDALSADLLRAEAMRAALVELGIDVDPPSRPPRRPA